MADTGKGDLVLDDLASEIDEPATAAPPVMDGEVTFDFSDEPAAEVPPLVSETVPPPPVEAAAVESEGEAQDEADGFDIDVGDDLNEDGNSADSAVSEAAAPESGTGDGGAETSFDLSAEFDATTDLNLAVHAAGLDSDSAAPDPDAPVLPNADAQEPPPVEKKPAVRRPTEPTLDVDAFLAEMTQAPPTSDVPEPPSPTSSKKTAVVAPPDVAPAVAAPSDAAPTDAAPADAAPTDAAPADAAAADAAPADAAAADAAPADAAPADAAPADAAPTDEAPPNDAAPDTETIVFAPEGEGAPPLIVSEDEPPAVPSSAVLTPDTQTMQVLRKLAGASTNDPEVAMKALTAALKDEPYNPVELPDSRAMALGIARVMVANGTDPDELVALIVHEMSKLS